MTIHNTPCGNSGKGKWKYYRDNYPNLPLKDRADFDAHVKRDHCAVCRHTRDHRTTEDALRAAAPAMRQAFEQQVAREADEVEEAVMEDVMAYWDDLTEALKERQGQPQRLRETAALTSRRTGRAANHARSRSTVKRPPLLQRVAALVTESSRTLWRRGGACVGRMGRLSVGTLLIAVAIPALILTWRKHSSQILLIPKQLARRRTRLRHAALLISVIVLAGSGITGCLLSTLLMDVLLKQAMSGWWRLAFATGSTTALSCIVFGGGVVLVSRRALKGRSWILGTLGRLLFVDEDPAKLSYLLHEATVRASLGHTHDVTITLSQDNRAGSAHEDLLSMQITRFRDNLPHTMTDSSELWSITWRELQDAWLEAFNAVAYSAGWPQVASEPIISPDALERRHVSPHLASSQFAQPLDPDQLLLCRTTASPGAESPWLMVCASIPTLAMAEPVSQVVPQALPESTVAVGVSGISETSVTDLRGERSLRRSVASTSLPRMTPQALARMQQQQARQIRARRAAQTRRAAAASAGVRPGQPTGDATRRREANRESMFLSILSGVTSWLKWACLTGLPRHWQPIASA